MFSCLMILIDWSINPQIPELWISVFMTRWRIIIITEIANLFSLPLKPNVEYTQSINNEFMTNAENYKVDSNEGKVIRVSKEQDLYKNYNYY